MASGSPFCWTTQPLYTIKCVVMLDSTGSRVFSKYYDRATFDSAQKETQFEQALFEKTRRSSSEILIFDNCLVVHRSLLDVIVFFVGNIDENELLITSSLNTFVETLHALFRNQVDKRTTLENLDYALLA